MQLGGSSRKPKAISWQRIHCVSGKPPKPRSSHSMTYDYKTNTYFVYGGEDNSGRAFDTNVYALNVCEQNGEMKAKWRILESNGETSGALSGHRSVLYQQHIYIFGGQNENGEYTNSVYKVNTATGTWEKLKCRGTLPAPRRHHSVTSIDNRMYVFGGCSEMGKLNDFYCFDMEKKKWQLMLTKDTKPKPCTGAGLYSFRNTNDDGDLISLIYGLGGDPFCADIYNYSCISCEWYSMSSKGTVPSPRSAFGACLLMAGEMFIFGGKLNSQDAGAAECSNDSYVYRLFGGQWNKLLLSSPDSVISPRSHVACARMKGLNQGYLVFGGLSCFGEQLGDLWYGALETM